MGQITHHTAAVGAAPVIHSHSSSNVAGWHRARELARELSALLAGITDGRHVAIIKPETEDHPVFFGDLNFFDPTDEDRVATDLGNLIVANEPGATVSMSHDAYTGKLKGVFIARREHPMFDEALIAEARATFGDKAAEELRAKLSK